MLNFRQAVLATLTSVWSLAVFAQQPPLPVIAVAAESRQIANPIEALGTLNANETAVLSANITATISRIRFDDGQRVKQGDVLVELTNREQLAQLREAEVSLADAERQLARARQLVESRVLSRQELDDRVRAVDIARAQLQAVQARLADRLIRAPFDSVVGLRQVSVGTLVVPGMPVATLHDDSVMKLDFSIPETLMAQITPGQELVATSRAYGDELFKGEIASLDNEVDPITRSIRVRALIDNADARLKPGMLMTVDLRSDARQAVVIPEEALLPLGRDQFVMVVEPQGEGYLARRQQVQTGLREPGLVEVTEGLEAGERVVTHGNFRLQPGQVISIKAELEPGESPRAVISATP
ncbi:efflux RND transporter periplasmic adaptor subunit [Halopseudomonas sp.]|uniref:efflux RND transporter periplasmic adaptor subunit n=1 Tax=Halopseudomonas sp. TaxID=2901191 RepID=UPI0035675616